MTRLFVVRHASHALLGKALVGRAPGVPLSPEGVDEAERLRDRLAAEPLARVLSSPIQRARETADIIAGPHACGVETTDDLIEIDCGAWTGASFEALESDPRWHSWNSERAKGAAPDGETMAAVQRRGASLLDRLSQAPGPIVLVSHSDVIKAMIASVIGMPLDFHHRLELDPGSITTIDMWHPGAGKIVRMNEVARA